MENDGTGFGYDLETAEKVAEIFSIPLIVAGGAGNGEHLSEGIASPWVNAVATANLFNFIGDGLPNARQEIISSKGNIAQWK